MRRTRREVVAAIRARQEALRSRRRRRDRRWLWLVVAAIVAIVLLRSCSCAGPPPEEPEGPAVQGTGVPGEPPPEPEPPLPAVERRDRPDFRPVPADALAWVGDYRLQVAARSPRLAECFVGAERPGTIKWTASVEPGSGRVSDHVLEPTLEADPLTSAQRACLTRVLSDPPYRLDAGDAPSTPSRVSIAIEF